MKLKSHTLMQTKLTAKQLKFCQEYAVDLNATQAAIRAGFSEKTAYSSGCRLLKNVEIEKYISELKSDLERTSGVTKLKLINILAKIAESNISKFYNSWIELKDFNSIPESEKSVIQEITTKTVKRNIGTRDEPRIIDVEYVKIKLYDKQAAVSKIAELQGFNQPTKIDLTTDLDKLNDADIDKIFERLIAASAQ